MVSSTLEQNSSKCENTAKMGRSCEFLQVMLLLQLCGAGEQCRALLPTDNYGLEIHVMVFAKFF